MYMCLSPRGGMYMCLSPRSGMYMCLSPRSGMYMCLSPRSGMYMCLSPRSGMYMCLSPRGGMYMCLSPCSGMYMCLSPRSGMYMCLSPLCCYVIVHCQACKLAWESADKTVVPPTPGCHVCTSTRAASHSISCPGCTNKGGGSGEGNKCGVWRSCGGCGSHLWCHMTRWRCYRHVLLSPHQILT